MGRALFCVFTHYFPLLARMGVRRVFLASGGWIPIPRAHSTLRRIRTYVPPGVGCANDTILSFGGRTKWKRQISVHYVLA